MENTPIQEMADRRESDNNPMLKAADSAVIKILARTSSIIILGLSIWILSNVSEMKGDIAVVKTKLEMYDNRITALENWRNSYGAYVPAPPVPIPVPSVRE